ncbi:MAG: VWA domain-containing protein [Terriglobia bacterium]
MMSKHSSQSEIARALSALAAAVLFSTAALAGGQKTSTPPASVLKVRTEVVNVYAVVRDKKGRLISDLPKSDFELTEDGVPQTIRYFSRAPDTPLTIALMIDTSPSQQSVLPLEQQEAAAFINEVMRPKDLMCVLHFDVDVELLQDFTASGAFLRRAIAGTAINGGGRGPLPSTFPSTSAGATHLYDAVWLVSTQLMNSQVGRKIAVMLTDGEDQGSKETLSAALEAAQKADVIVYSVDIVDRAFYGVNNLGFNGDSVLKKFAQETGGEVIRASGETDTNTAFRKIADQLRTQYLLGYTPTHQARDGKYRKIRVRVRGNSYKVQARRGYYAPTR